MGRPCALGLDFGTASVRALLVDVADGTLRGCAAVEYAHGVMETSLEGERLPPDFALQHPDDYLRSLTDAVRQACRAGGVSPTDVIGLGVDFTACTMLPVDAGGVPLCRHEAFRRQPHAYVKLWKHHGAHAESAAINDLARRRDEEWLSRYGGTTSPEWLLAKAWETLRKAPEVYAAAHRFVEASDWVVEQLGGDAVRGACAAGYKGMAPGGEPCVDEAFLRELDEGLVGFYGDKVRGEVVPAGTRVGTLNAAWSERLGLAEGTPLSAPIIDAHAAVAGCGVVGPQQMVAILGTSTCHMVMETREVRVPGIQGVVDEGILPGFYGYEAGQASTGDLLEWWVDHIVREPAESAHRRLSEEAATLRAGECGLLVLDWWNGNRSILVDPRLTGAVVGLTKATEPRDLYRGLLEGTAFGTRRILDQFTESGVGVRELFVCGGMATKNELLLQIYADVSGRVLTQAGSPEVCALGAAMFGALAAGSAGGGFATVTDAALAMVPAPSARVTPRADEHARYERIYALWRRLHDQLGEAQPELMHALRDLKDEVTT